MKKFSKVFMGVTAFVMAFSVTALSACSNTKDKTDNTPPAEPAAPVTPTEPTTPAEPAAPGKSDTVKILEALQTQSFKAANFAYTQTQKDKSVQHLETASGERVPGFERTLFCEGENSYDFKVNVKTLEMDVYNFNTFATYKEDGVTVETDATNYTSYEYSFVRGGKTFYAEAEEEATDLSQLVLTYDSSSDFSAGLTAMLAQMPEDGAPANLLASVTALLNLAGEYGDADFADKKLTVDLNKVAYGLYNDVLALIEELDGDTTVGEIIAAKPVKVLIEALTYGMDAKEVLEQALAIVGGADTLEGEGPDGSAMIAAVLEVLPEAEEGESVYDYLVKLLESKKVAELVFGMIAPGAPASAVAPIAQFKVIDIVRLVMASVQDSSAGATPLGGVVYDESAEGGITMAQVKETVALYLDTVTVTEDKITVETDDAKIEFSALELVFSVGDDYTVSSVSVGAKLNEVSRADAPYEPGITSVTESEEERTFRLDLTFASDEYTLADISDNKAEITSHGYADGIYYTNQALATVDIMEEGAQQPETTRIYAGVEIAGGEMVSVKLYTTQNEEQYTVIADSESVNDVLTINYGNYITGTQFEITVEESPSIQVRLFKIAEGELMWNIENYPYVACDSQVTNASVYIHKTDLVSNSTVAEILAGSN